MITLREILSRTKAAYSNCEIRFLYPSIYIVVSEDAFKDKNAEQRLSIFALRTQLEQLELESLLSFAGFSLCLIVPEERNTEYAFLDDSPHSHHWVEFLTDPTAKPSATPSIPFVHFYGFKGGQARSTVLAMIAQSLADDGYKVLVVDADIEAPSMQAVFESKTTNLDATILGCAQYKLQPIPQSVFVSKTAGGLIDMIACRPADKQFDLDFANFALKASLDPSILSSVISKLLAAEGTYDMILVDHRSGLSSSVVPIVAGFPGPVIICLRLDEQSDRAEAYFDVLLRINTSNPGLFVSFSLDPEDTDEAIMGRHRGRIEALLESISASLNQAAIGDREYSDALDGDSTEPGDLLAYWIPWFHDRSFLGRRLPSTEAILSVNQRALKSIRELLDYASPKIASETIFLPAQTLAMATLTGSGSTDQGALIETDDLRKLRAQSSPFTYIMGRKGTGKTRLLRALVELNLGDPMLVAEDFPYEKGILSSDLLLGELADRTSSDTTKFWWCLLDAVISGDTRNEQQDRLKEILDLGIATLTASSVKEKILCNTIRRTLLIDGVETAFTSGQMPTFVEGLFRFLASVQSDIDLNQCLTIRLFIRTDLAEGARENVEQQTENRVIYLAWNTQSILNFVLVRMGSLPWFRATFPHTVKKIEALLPDLIKGNVLEDECNHLLLEVFPVKLRRNNLLTLTFLKTYFSDGQGDNASFYPRIYDSFLKQIANGGSEGQPNAAFQLENDRIRQKLIFEAHDYACKDYLKQVRDELKNLVSLAEEPNSNQQRISDLLDGFAGMKTPFMFEECAKTLADKLYPRIDVSVIRRAMLQMKRVGIFEDRPDYPGYWRVGRLFKSSLGMRYQR